jgi:predicted TPR repeat methyltransferase
MSEAQTPDHAPRELTIEGALQMAIAMHRERQFQGAEELCRRILGVAPGHPDALHLLGVQCHQMGKSDEGLGHIQASIAAVPNFPGFYNNLGNVHMSRGEVPEALSAYQRASALDPDNADLHNNLGALYKAERRFAEAQAAYEHAIALEATHLNAHNNLGLLYAELGDRPKAIHYYVRALELMPGNDNARRLLGTTYYSLGRIAEAGEVYRQWLALEPDNPMARHMFSACTGEGVPERADDTYVEQTFDRFAASFEDVLNERLGYQAPQLCADMLARHLPPPQRQFVMLDAGAGTGLCGPLMAPWARTLAGVDLSRGMLDIAQTKGVYQDLYKAELTEFLKLSPGQWDVVLSADTLCYFGDLTEVTAAAAGSLQPGGTLIYTVEALPEDSRALHQIQPHGRDPHQGDHSAAARAQAGLRLLEREAVVLRQEGGKPVHGWLVAARRQP